MQFSHIVIQTKLLNVCINIQFFTYENKLVINNCVLISVGIFFLLIRWRDAGGYLFIFGCPVGNLSQCKTISVSAYACIIVCVTLYISKLFTQTSLFCDNFYVCTCDKTYPKRRTRTTSKSTNKQQQQSIIVVYSKK